MRIHFRNQFIQLLNIKWTRFATDKDFTIAERRRLTLYYVYKTKKVTKCQRNASNIYDSSQNYRKYLRNNLIQKQESTDARRRIVNTEHRIYNHLIIRRKIMMSCIWWI